MHLVYTNSATQSERKEGSVGTIQLLMIIDEKISEYRRSGRATMPDLVVPLSITHISIEGHVYRIEENVRRRKVWFGLSQNGHYDFTSFYISEVIDADGAIRQLHIDQSGRPQGTHDDLKVIRAKRLGGGTGSFYGGGRSPNIDGRS